MLLAVLMVLTMAPVSGLAALADDGYEYVTPTLTPVSFTVDTTATTEVTRIAAGSGLFSLPDGTAEAPNTIVSATPSGIPETGGAFAHIAYAGETPSLPKLVFKITGATLTDNPQVTPSAGDISLGPVQKTTEGSNTTVYTYEVSGNGSSLGVGTDIVYEIDYVVNDVAYKTYAYSHIENIIVMNGAVSYRDKEHSGDRTRQSSVIQFQSHNMYTRMNGADLNVSTGYETDPSASSVSNRVLGYINYSSSAKGDGGDLLGLGSGTDLSSAANAYGSAAPNGAIAGTEQAALIKHVNKDNAETRNMCTHNDTNRGEPVIYLDATDTLDSLNFRMTLQNAELSDFTSSTINSVRFVQIGAANLADDCAISDEIYEQTGTAVSTSEITYLGNNFGSVTTIPANDYSSYAMAKFAGPGPAASPSLNDNYTAFASWNTAASGNGPIQTTIGLNLIFRKYNTRDLRAIYNGVLKGDGSKYDCVVLSGTSVTFNRGVNPRAEMYVINSTDRNGNAYSSGETDWTMFVKALNTAGTLLARPDLNQTQIDDATRALISAYSNLEGYSPTYNVEIHHCYAGTNDPIVVNGKELIQKVNGGNPVASGQTISSAAATITGYTAVGETVRKDDISGKTNDETGTNKLIIRYFYQADKKHINVAPNNPKTDANPNGVNNYMLTYGYDQVVDLTAKNADGTPVFNYGARDNYTFAGWLNDFDGVLYDVLSPTGTKSFRMPNDEIKLEGQWVITPLKVIGIPVTNKGVVFEGKQLGDDIVLADEETAVTFSQPTKYVSSVAADGTKTYQNGQYLNDGYLFGGYYESYNAETGEFGNPVSWPLSFKFGDSDKTIYIRWVDVNGTVSFETNGGSAINDITYTTTPAAITAPADPVRKGYDFAGWYADEALTTRIKADDGTDWTVGKVKTQQTQTGFLAYAKWEAQYHTITFNMGAPTSAFDTTTEQMPIYEGKSDTPFDDILPAVPAKYGKVFTQWGIQGSNEVYNFDYYPQEDIVLTPVWNNTQYSAFISIGAYEKLATGESTIVAPTSTATGSAQAGDIVTFRMTSLTNFYVGSSVFVFMYDKNFYDLVAEGTSAFVLNSDNEYVAGIEASAVGVTNDATLSRVWPSELADVRADYNAMMVTIDPTVTSTNYNCEPMSDGKWLVEFKLKVKDTATEGDSGTVYMSNEWTRTADNIMGTMFYGWAETGDATVAETYNQAVTPNLDTATATIQIDPTPAVDTTVHLVTNGGTWADGSAGKLTYTGREATEIADFAAPSKTGYNFKKDAAGNNIWYKYDEATGTVDESVTWIEGYYATAETDGLTFAPAWEGIPYTVNYYVDMGGELWDTEEVVFGEAIKGPFYEVEKEGYEFVEWQDAEGNVYVEGETLVPEGGVDLYAQWIAGMVNYTITVNYFDNNAGAQKTYTSTKTARAESTVIIAEAAGTEDATYVLWSEISVPRGYVIDKTDERNNGASAVIKGDGSTVINVYAKGDTIVYTFDATAGGTFPSTGTQTITSSGEFYTAFDVATIETPVKDGYVFKAWSPTPAKVYNQNRTYTATWEVKKVPVTFNAGEGTFGTTNESSSQLNHGTAITAPTAPTREGYNFLGWAATEGGAVLDTLGTATDYDNGHTFYAVWAKATYAVTYKVDGALYATEDVEFEGTVTVKEFPADITGYTFAGWNYNGTTYAPGASFTMPAGAVVINGEFVADIFDATFDATGGYFNGDESITTVTVETAFDMSNTSPAKPFRNGYEFLGWTLTEGSSTIDLAENADFTMDAEGKTYYAVWKATIADYTIEVYEMDVNGAYPETATSSTVMSGQVEGEVNAPTPEKTGFTLDAAASKLSGTVTPAPDNLVLKVYYARNQHTITWIDEAGSTTQNVYYGAAIVAPTAAEKVGYTFSAWDLDVADTMPDYDLSYTAVYSANSYPVVFYKDADKAETVYSGNVAYGTALSGFANVPTKEGYQHIGWAYDGTETVLDLATETVPVGGVTLIGIWKKEVYSVNFRAGAGSYENGTNVKTVPVEYGAAVVVPEEPTQTGKTFAGWNPAIPATMPDAGNDGGIYNFVARWTDEAYTVNFVIDGTTITNEYAYGSAIEVPDETQTVKDGYTFKYWTDASGSRVEIPETMEDIGANGASVTYTAYFEVNKYTVTWDVDGATTEVDYEFGATIEKIADPEKTGYTFAGWSPAVDATMPAKDVTYKATWTVNNYTVTWVFDNGDADLVVSYAYGAAINKIADPVKTGYTFAGWSPAVDATMPANNVTYTAQWTINSYIATFVAEDVTVETKSYEYGAAVEMPATDPSKEGYTFIGWKAADGTVYGADATLPAMGAADVNYTAEFEINTYSVTWDVDGDTTVVEYNYGATVKMATKPSKTGYTFSGWKNSATGEIFADGATLPAMGAADVTYTAQWNIDSYTVTFVSEKATYETKSYEYNSAVAKPAVNPTKLGYTFVAWVAADGTEYDANTALPAMGTENVTYTAKFEINQYTVLFNALDGVFANGNSTYAITQNYNAMATKPADPTQTGYTFKGWTTVENGTEADIVVVPSTWYMEAEDVTYYAVWVINSYTVTFYSDAEGTQVAYTTELVFGEAIKEPAAYDASFVNPALENYTFEGWSLSEVELGQYAEDVEAYVIDFAAAAPTVPAQKIEIYPVFARVVVALAIPADSTAEILKYDDETKIGYVTGLETLLDEDTLLSTYLAVKGDGRLEVTLTKYGVCGTGTKVEVIDNLTDKPVETYFIIIYGDVNGDAYIDATDASIVYNEAAGATYWSLERSEAYDYCMVVAADIHDKDGLVSAADATAISDIALYVADVDQVTGNVEYYYI